MVKVKIDKYGQRYVEGIVTLNIKAYLQPEEPFDEITEEDAEFLLTYKLYSLADSNDGYELFLNAKPIIKNDD